MRIWPPVKFVCHVLCIYVSTAFRCDLAWPKACSSHQGTVQTPYTFGGASWGGHISVVFGGWACFCVWQDPGSCVLWGSFLWLQKCSMVDFKAGAARELRRCHIIRVSQK